MKNRNIYLSTCCDKSDGLPHDELKAVLSAQIAMLNTKSSGGQLNEKKKKKRWIKIEFWRIPKLMAHLEDDLYF